MIMFDSVMVDIRNIGFTVMTSGMCQWTSPINIYEIKFTRMSIKHKFFGRRECQCRPRSFNTVKKRPNYTRTSIMALVVQVKGQLLETGFQLILEEGNIDKLNNESLNRQLDWHRENEKTYKVYPGMTFVPLKSHMTKSERVQQLKLTIRRYKFRMSVGTATRWYSPFLLASGAS